MSQKPKSKFYLYSVRIVDDDPKRLILPVFYIVSVREMLFFEIAQCSFELLGFLSE